MTWRRTRHTAAAAQELSKSMKRHIFFEFSQMMTTTEGKTNKTARTRSTTTGKMSKNGSTMSFPGNKTDKNRRTKIIHVAKTSSTRTVTRASKVGRRQVLKAPVRDRRSQSVAW